MRRNHRAWVRSQIVVETVSRINSDTITRQGQLSEPTAAVTKRLRHTATKRWHNPSSNISNNGINGDDIVDGDDDIEGSSKNLRPFLGQTRIVPCVTPEGNTPAVHGHTTHH